MQIKEKIVVSTIDKAKSLEAIALFDTGAKSTFISEGLAKKLGFRPYPKPIKIPLVVKDKIGEVTGETTLIFTIAECEIPFGYATRVVRDLSEEVVIGSSFMEEFEMELDMKEGRARLRKVPPELRLV